MVEWDAVLSVPGLISPNYDKLTNGKTGYHTYIGRVRLGLLLKRPLGSLNISIEFKIVFTKM